MGKVMSRLNKQYYRFNAENRAHREISKLKPTPAPRHPSTEKAMQKLLEETKHIKEEAMIKNPVLDGYLKKVYVVSHDPVVEEKKKKPSEKARLPLNRMRPEETELGYQEPLVIPKGKITLFQAMKFLADHQGDPKLFNTSKIASDYSLTEEDVEDVLQYFRSFKIHVKEESVMLESNKGVKDRVLKFIGYNKKEATSFLPKKGGGDIQRKPPET